MPTERQDWKGLHETHREGTLEPEDLIEAWGDDGLEFIHRGADKAEFGLAEECSDESAGWIDSS